MGCELATCDVEYFANIAVASRDDCIRVMREII
jgi:hypothetical protein